MPPPSKWAHDEGLRLRATGMSIPAIAKLMEVSDSSVRLVCDPAYRESCRESARRRGKSNKCIDCGATIWTATHGGSGLRCQPCAILLRAVTVRESELHCCECGQWKPDSAFSHRAAATARRGRHSVCSTCQAPVRQRNRVARRVSCKKCGQPCSHPNDTREATGLCLNCYRAMKAA